MFSEVRSYRRNCPIILIKLHIVTNFLQMEIYHHIQSQLRTRNKICTFIEVTINHVC